MAAGRETPVEGVSAAAAAHAASAERQAALFFSVLSPLYRWGNGGPEKVSDLPEATARKVQC